MFKSLEECLKDEIKMSFDELIESGDKKEDYQWIFDDYADDLSTQAYILSALSDDD